MPRSTDHLSGNDFLFSDRSPVHPHRPIRTSQNSLRNWGPTSRRDGEVISSMMARVEQGFIDNLILEERHGTTRVVAFEAERDY